MASDQLIVFLRDNWMVLAIAFIGVIGFSVFAIPLWRRMTRVRFHKMMMRDDEFFRTSYRHYQEAGEVKRPEQEQLAAALLTFPQINPSDC